MLSRILLLIASASFSLSLAACAADSAEPVTSDDDLTASSAKKLGVPLEILNAAFFDKASPQDQTGLGILLAPDVAFARGATSGSLPYRATLDQKPLAKLQGTKISVGDEDELGLLLDYAKLDAGEGERLLGRAPPPLMPPSDMHEGLSCRALGADFDMYAVGPPKALALAATIMRVTANESGKGWHAVAKTTKSTGGDLTLLVCNGKLAGIAAGAGSQGTTFEFRSLDEELLAAVARAHAEGCRRCK